MTRYLSVLTLALSLALSQGAVAAPEPALQRLTYEYLFLAEALMRHQRYAEARIDLSKLFERVRDNAYEAAVVLQTWAYAELGDGHQQAAAQRLSQALAYQALPPAVATPLRFTLAQWLASQGRHKEAAEQLRQGLAQHAQPAAQTHLLAAQVYGALKQYAAAIKHARAALQAAPADEARYRLLLSLYLQAGQWQNASDLLAQDMLRLYPRNAGYWRQLAASLSLAHRQGLLEAADIRRLAQLYLHLQAPHKAAVLLREALAAHALPSSARHLRLLASAWQAAREPAAAIAAYQQAGGAMDLLRAGELLLAQEDWRQARDALRAAMTQEGLETPGRAYLLLGISELRLQHPQTARRAFAQAREQAASDPLRKQAQQWLQFLEQT